MDADLVDNVEDSEAVPILICGFVHYIRLLTNVLSASRKSRKVAFDWKLKNIRLFLFVILGASFDLLECFYVLMTLLINVN